MMSIAKEGDTRQIVCFECGLTQATYLVRNVSFNEQTGVVKNLLVAVCNNCQQVVSMPKQSVVQVKAEYQKTRLGSRPKS